MLFRLKARIRKKWFDFNCRNVLYTAPLQPTSDNVVIVSEVGNRDVIMYLVAIKSFYNFLKRGSVILLLDEDCPSDQVEILKRHVNPLEILHVQAIRSEFCPQGGTWERLLTIADKVANNYVIQVDSDTLTTKRISEVSQAVDANCSFMLSEWENQKITSMEDACSAVKGNSNQHVQMLAEQNLFRLRDYSMLRYARGQSSFAGFAKGSFSRERLEKFSAEMQHILGKPKWHEWGSESLASNVMVSNSPQAVMLPYPKYASYYPSREVNFDASAFVHFEGTNRLKNGLYVRKSRQVIDRLLRD